MEIQPNQVRPGADSAPQGLDTLQGGGEGLAAAIRAAQHLDLGALAAALQDGVPTGANASGDGIVNANGLPTIPVPQGGFSTADMVDLLRSLQTKMHDGQLRSAKENLENNRIEQANNNALQKDKIEEWIEKAKKAESGGILGKIFGWIGAIVAVIAAVVLSVAAIASGGAAAPLAVAAVIACISAVSMLTSQISQEAGGGPAGLFGVLSDLCTKMLVAFGMDEETAEKVGKMMVGAAMIATGLVVADPSCVGELVGSFAQLCGASDEVAGYISMALNMLTTVVIGVLMAVLSGGATAAATVAKVTSIIASVVQGVGQVATGAESIDTAFKQKDADAALASKKELEALMLKLQASMEEDRERLKEVLVVIDESMQLVSKMLREFDDSVSQITQNIGKRAMV